MIRQNFIYPKIDKGHYRFGSNKISGVILNHNGDWRGYLPPGETQNKNGVESSACYIEAQQHTIATILEEQYTILDSNFSARFNAILSNGTLFGGDPLAGADSIRDDGLINDDIMPFSNEIESWDDFHSWKGANQNNCIKYGKEFVSQWKLNNDIVFERDEPLDLKFKKLKEALKYSPVPMSVYGVVDSYENYVVKPIGANDTHLVEAIYVDNNNCIYIWDTYAPFLKKLPANYNSDFAIRWSVNKRLQKKSLMYTLRELWQWFLKEKLIVRAFKLDMIKNDK